MIPEGNGIRLEKRVGQVREIALLTFAELRFGEFREEIVIRRFFGNGRCRRHFILV